MRIESTLPRRRRIPLTSLIDVIFLLLLFFMLSSTFARFAEVKVSGARASQASTALRPDIFLRLDADGGWSVNGNRLDPDVALAELERLQTAGARSAVMMVRDGVTSQALVSAIERIRAMTGLSLSVAR